MSGKGIVDCSFFMHYNDNAYKNLVDLRKSELSHPLITITDENALIYSFPSLNGEISNNQLILDYTN